MCKVFMMPGMNKGNRQEVTHFLKIVSKELSGTSDKDGFGYAAITRTGQVYGEKWLNPSDAWKIAANPDNIGNKFLMDNFSGALKKQIAATDDIYKKFGQMKTAKVFEDTCAVILHARHATTGSKTIDNVHPFFESANADGAHGDTALIHNGNVANHELLTKKHSTCDSEVILHEYLRLLVQYAPQSIDQLSKMIYGNYVVGVLSSASYEAETITPYLDIFKSGYRDLYVSYIERFRSPVFATTPDIIKNACKEMNITHSEILEIEGGTFMRLDAITGRRIDDVIKFTESPISAPAPSYPKHVNHHYHEGADWSGWSKEEEEADEKKVLPLHAMSTNLEKEKKDFRDEYFVPAKLTEEDERTLEELAKNGDRKPAVIHLVRKALEAAGKVAVQ